MYDSNIFKVNPKKVLMTESPARGERIDAIVGGMYKKDHKLQKKVREVYASIILLCKLSNLNMD